MKYLGFILMVIGLLWLVSAREIREASQDKASRFDLFQIGFGGCKHIRYLTLRWYREVNWGWRNLGPHRKAFDMGRIAVVFERYNA